MLLPRFLVALGPACLCLAGCSRTHPLSQPSISSPHDPGTVVKVYIFVNNDCPIANRYAPEIRRLHELYRPRGVAFWMVHSDPQETEAAVRQHDREYGLNLPNILDADQSVARRCGAEIVPSVFVFSAGDNLVYHGRIDDRFPEIGRERLTPSKHDLAEALDAILAHRPVPVPATKAVGCYISYSQERP